MARLIPVLAAVATAAWLALGLRSANEVNQGLIEVGRAGQKGDRQGELRSALATFERARRFNADASVLVREGRSLVLVGANDEAVRAFEDATAREPDNADAWFLLSIAARRAGDRDGAAAARRRAEALDPPIRRAQ